MKLGMGLPNGGPSSLDGAELVRLAVGAEALGLDSVWTVDRWLRPHAPVAMPGVPGPVTMPAASYASVFDPIELLTFVAARTDRIELGTSAVNALYHPPVLLARRLATLDQLARGRVLAGVTSGWMTEEFEAAGVSPAWMGDGFDEHLAVLRAVWGPDPVEFEGARYQLALSDIGPKPRRAGGIPLLIGYNTDAGIRRAARIGDGLHPARNNVAQLAADLQLWRATAEQHGRDPATMPVVLRASASLGTTDASSPGLFTGEVEGWPGDLDRLDALGVDHVLLQLGESADVDTTLAVFDRLLALLR